METSAASRHAAWGALQTASATTDLVRDLTDMLQIAPAAAATSLLLMIFNTIEGIHVNKAACNRLARRSARLLLDIHSAMEGRWHDAPPSLVENLNKLERFVVVFCLCYVQLYLNLLSTLSEIHTFMLQQASLKWHSRVMRKGDIDRQIEEFTVLLEDSMRSFQATTLIHVHHIISKRPRDGLNSHELRIASQEASTLDRAMTKVEHSSSGDLSKLLLMLTSTVLLSHHPLYFIQARLLERPSRIWTRMISMRQTRVVKHHGRQ
ncbi:hypothetical protein BDW22DRAFT_228480 [Trametopsis cervina]|nr:hypothetical protein BDW22DRAFT_228480 [Trametopsis cervina]